MKGEKDPCVFERPQHIPIRFDLQAPLNPSMLGDVDSPLRAAYKSRRLTASTRLNFHLAQKERIIHEPTKPLEIQATLDWVYLPGSFFWNCRLGIRQKDVSIGGLKNSGFKSNKKRLYHGITTQGRGFSYAGDNDNALHSSRLQNRMLGIQEQAKRSLAALYASSSSTESNSERMIQKLTDEINKSDEIIDDFDVPSERLAGRAIIKETVARRLNELNNKRGASIQEVKDQIKAFTHDIEVTSGSRHIRRNKVSKNEKPQTRFSCPRVSLRLYRVRVDFLRGLHLYT